MRKEKGQTKTKTKYWIEASSSACYNQPLFATIYYGTGCKKCFEEIPILGENNNKAKWGNHEMQQLPK